MVQGLQATVQNAGNGPLGCSMAEHPDETCAQCCVRQRFRWLIATLVLGGVAILVGAIILWDYTGNTGETSQRQWKAGLGLFIAGICIIIIALLTFVASFYCCRHLLGRWNVVHEEDISSDDDGNEEEQQNIDDDDNDDDGDEYETGDNDATATDFTVVEL